MGGSDEDQHEAETGEKERRKGRTPSVWTLRSITGRNLYGQIYRLLRLWFILKNTTDITHSDACVGFQQTTRCPGAETIKL